MFGSHLHFGLWPAFLAQADVTKATTIVLNPQ
jgi:hypothetical protein